MLNRCFWLPMKDTVKGQGIINISKKCLNDLDCYAHPISTLWYELKSHSLKIFGLWRQKWSSTFIDQQFTPMLIQDLSMAAPARPWIPIQSLPPWFYSHLNAPLTTTSFWLASKSLQYIVLMSCVTGEAWRSWWADFFTPFSHRVCRILEAVELRKRLINTPTSPSSSHHPPVLV